MKKREFIIIPIPCKDFIKEITPSPPEYWENCEKCGIFMEDGNEYWHWMHLENPYPNDNVTAVVAAFAYQNNIFNPSHRPILRVLYEEGEGCFKFKRK